MSVGVWYGGAAPGDLHAIRRLGFNSVTVPVDWKSAEPERGGYRSDPLDHRLAAADEAGLKVIVQLVNDPAPAWVLERYPDARIVSDAGRNGPRNAPRLCLDHPGARADLAAFVAAVSAGAARHSSFHAIDVGTVDGGIVCYCAHTERRFREWLRQKYGSLDAMTRAWARTFSSWDSVRAPRGARGSAERADWSTFVAVKLREDLKMQADASAPRGRRPVAAHVLARPTARDSLAGRPHQDDWWMATAVDTFGAALHPRPSGAAPWSAVQLALALDAIRSAGRDRGWWASDVQAGQAATAADVRLWAWAALARGARAIGFSPWETDGPLSARARAMGQFADLVTRNAALFEPLRPRPSRVAILDDRPIAVPKAASTPAAQRDSIVRFYRAMFERNIQTDFVHPDDVVSGLVSKYAVVYADPAYVPPTVADALKVFDRSGGTVLSEGSRGRVDGVGPDVRIDGGAGSVEARFLESADALVLVAINHADTPQKVTFTFAPDMPEAVWQNMETGAAVNFVAGPDGPTYARAFAPRDVLVLMIRKRLR